MPIYSTEDKIILAIKVIRISRNTLSQRVVIRMYNIPLRLLNDRINSHPQRKKKTY